PRHPAPIRKTQLELERPQRDRRGADAGVVRHGIHGQLSPAQAGRPAARFPRLPLLADAPGPAGSEEVGDLYEVEAALSIFSVSALLGQTVAESLTRRFILDRPSEQDAPVQLNEFRAKEGYV